MGSLAFVLIAGALVLLPDAAASDSRLVFGRPTDETRAELGYSPAVAGASSDLRFGAPVGDKTPVTIPADGFRLPLVRVDGGPPWLRTGPTILRLATPATGELAVEGEKPVLRLVGRLTLEDADGKVLKEFECNLTTEFPDGYVAGDVLQLRVTAQRVLEGKVVGPPVSFAVPGSVEELP